MTIVLTGIWLFRGVETKSPGAGLSLDPVEAVHVANEESDAEPPKDSGPRRDQVELSDSSLAEERPTFDSSEFNSSFRDVTAYEQQRYGPQIEAKLYPRGRPERYLRHRLVEIDVGAFKKTLEEGYSKSLEGSDSQGVQIPLFSDEVLDFVVTDWLITDGGFVSATGHLANLPSPESTVWVHFDHLGSLKIIVRQHSGSHVVEPLGEETKYVVQSLAPLPADMSFE